MSRPKVGDPLALFKVMTSLKTTFAKITSPALSVLFNAPVALLSATLEIVAVDV